MNLDALCVGAHPDDVEIGMGATVAGMVRRGMSVTICDLTDGEPTPRGSVETRAREAASAASVLGAGRVTLGLRNRELFDCVESRRALAEVIRETRPRMVFAPFPTDAHPDHVAASAICDAARFYAKFTKTDMRGEPFYPPKLLNYLAVHLRLLAKPSFLVVAERGDLEAKSAALGCYESQFSANPANSGVPGMVMEMARMWGALVSAEAAEPFFSREEIGVADIRHVV